MNKEKINQALTFIISETNEMLQAYSSTLGNYNMDDLDKSLHDIRQVAMEALANLSDQT